MSDDLLLLESATLLAGRRIDSVRVTQERFARDLREREMLQLTAEAELRALRAQLNPHFLFNALTTVGYLVKTAPERALGALYRLTDLLRAVLRRPAGELVTLGEELEIVEAYLAIERERFQDRLTVVVDVPEDLRQQLVPPLLLQPLVENALKHGIAPLRRGGTVTVVARTDMTTDSSLLSITVTDSGVGLDARVLETRRADGLGLANIEARIERLFGTRGALRLSAAQGGGTSAELRLPVSGSGRGEKARTPRPAA
jgi:two-component system sensor histidine kinase LytS